MFTKTILAVLATGTVVAACVAGPPVMGSAFLAGSPPTIEPARGADPSLALPPAPPAGPVVPDEDIAESAPPSPPIETLTRPERQWRWITEASDERCREALGATEAEFTALPDVGAPDKNGCGIPRGIILKRGVTGVRYSPPLRIDCSFAVRLGEVERILAEEAKEHFDAKPARIGHVGTYVCREVIGRLRGRSGGISEHSFGNAVDVTHVDLDSGRRISVLQHYRNEAAPIRPYRELLHDVLRRVRSETGMRGLGPDFDASHRTHFHFDAGSRWWRW